MMFYRRETFKDFLKRYPILSIIIAANTITFLYIGLRFGIWGSVPVVIKGGIIPLTVELGEYWRHNSRS